MCTWPHGRRRVVRRAGRFLINVMLTRLGPASATTSAGDFLFSVR